MRRSSQSAWLATLLLGAVAAILGLIVPVTGLFLALAVTIVVLVLPGPGRFGFAGAWLGFGGTWTAMLGRAGVDCLLGAETSGACGGSLFQTYLAVGLLMAVVGLLATARAFRDVRAA